MGKNAVKVTLTSRQSGVLDPLARSRTAPQRLVERCLIVLMSAEGRDNEDQGEELGVDRPRVRRWRGRWASASGALSSAENEGASDKDLKKLILTVLAEDARSGTPAKFTPAACFALDAHRARARSDQAEDRRDHLPKAHRPFFSEADLRPHKSQYWLSSPDKRDAPAEYQAAVENICNTYRDAPRLAAQGTHVVSTDEKTGMQALQRLHETKPVRAGLVERVEFEYIRHGTLCLMAKESLPTATDAMLGRQRSR